MVLNAASLRTSQAPECGRLLGLGYLAHKRPHCDHGNGDTQAPPGACLVLPLWASACDCRAPCRWDSLTPWCFWLCHSWRAAVQRRGGVCGNGGAGHATG